MKSINLQDTFLNQIRKSNTSVTVFLLNGFQLKGVVKSYDNFKVLLESEGKQHLIYKHAISTFVPFKTVALTTEEEQFLITQLRSFIELTPLLVVLLGITYNIFEPKDIGGIYK